MAAIPQSASDQPQVIHTPPTQSRDMLLGISALLISATFLLYNHPPRAWLQLFRQWGQRGLAAPPKSDDIASEPAPGSSHKSPPPPVADERKPAVSIQVPRLDEVPSEDSESAQTTPKATVFPAVPIFTVASSDHDNHDDDDDEGDDGDSLPPPSFPAVNSAQRTSGPSPAPSALKSPSAQPSSLAPPRLAPAPRLQQQRSGGLMPPPRMPASSLRTGPSGPLPNRGPPRSGGGGGGGGVFSSNLGLPMAAPVKTPNPRAKVSLTPGHSPLDWAALVKSSANLSGVGSLRRVAPSELKRYNGRKNKQTGETMPAWSAYQGKVYNITPYLPYHPGGEGELRRAAGKDGGKLFNEVHPWVNWDNMLSECVVGILVPEHSAEDPAASSLDDMD
ncbi:heme steroid binding protein [Diplodia corticola]|uniref:Heme steroid binding protein n=1 Tax=Diplodia corticola TaxID=236234 RepID=A0A1J9SAB0_9PEZI|nr:heme steroid binding protein [Diplodia corticola]OJD36820.1 heme steroid binding protein [Diplodia corticola]